MTDAGDGLRWFAVRCLFESGTSADGDPHTYEERVTLWRAADADAAIALAEAEAAEYVDDLGHPRDAYLGLAQSYELADEVGHGAEVFSLMRDSRLAPDDYLDRFFDSGDERQQQWSPPYS